MVSRLVEVARQVPGVQRAEQEYARAEIAALRELARLLDDAGRVDTGTRPVTADAAPAALSEPLTAAERMRDLLRRSMQHTPTESRHELHKLLLGELVPDEARILSALSDGSSYPMVHIAEPGMGTYQRRVLENASSIGRAAGVALPDRTHLYVAHLRRLGLVESGEPDPSLTDEYDILLSDQVVRAAVAAVGRGPRSARIVRRTIKASALGLELWEATQPGEAPDPLAADGDRR